MLWLLPFLRTIYGDNVQIMWLADTLKKADEQITSIDNLLIV